MSDLYKAFLRFRRPFRTVDGRDFLGQLTEAREDFQIGTFVFPRRFLWVSQHSEIHPGDTFIAYGHAMLAIDNADSSDGKIRKMKVVTLDQKLAWTRANVVTDSITGLEREAGAPINLGDLYCVLEPIHQVSEVRQVDVTKYRMLCGPELRLKDRVGSYTVERVERILGVTLAEVI